MEAAEASVAICALGLDRLAHARGADPVDLLASVGADRLFQIGWKLRSEDRGG